MPLKFPLLLVIGYNIIRILEPMLISLLTTFKYEEHLFQFNFVSLIL